MKVKCMLCNVTIRTLEGEGTSHGVCEKCQDLYEAWAWGELKCTVKELKALAKG